MTRWSPSSVLVVIALVVAGLVVLDLGMPSAASDSRDPVAAGPAVGGAWYCAAGGVGETDDLSVLTATPMTSSSPSDTEIRALDGQSTVVAAQPVFPGSARLTDLEVEGVGGDGAVGAAVRWWDEPTATSRIWRIGGQGATGLVSGPCASAPSPTWYVPGLSTAEGGSAQLYLANPFGTDASVSISFTTPSGPVAPILLENVSVPAASVATLELGEYIPRQADIGVSVTTRSGRVVVEGVQRLDPAIGGIDAVALVRAAPRLSETWTIPWSLTDPSDEATPAGEGDIVGAPASTEDAGSEEPTTDASSTSEPAPTESDPTEPDPSEAATEVDPEELETEAPSANEVRTASPGKGTASWIWVSNPGVEAAAVTVTLHTATGPVVPDIGDELLIEGGQVLRVDLRGLLPPGQSAAGATVRSENGVPVVAGMATLVAPEADNPDRTGYTSQLGWPESDSAWVVPGETGEGRQQVLHLVNPGADDARVDVAVWDGAALRRPEGLQGVRVGAGSLLELDVTEVVAGAEHMAAFVTATEGSVVAGRHSVGEDPADWVAHTGVPARLWSGGDVVPPVDHDPQLIERLGTTGGLPAVDPDAVDPDAVEPSPDPTLAPSTPPTPTTPSESSSTEAG